MIIDVKNKSSINTAKNKKKCVYVCACVRVCVCVCMCMYTVAHKGWIFFFYNFSETVDNKMNHSCKIELMYF